MDPDVLKSQTKDLNILLKKLHLNIQHTANSYEYSKFMQKTLLKMKTFDIDDESYIDYGSKAIQTYSKRIKSKNDVKK
jgi:hypothetical protein